MGKSVPGTFIDPAEITKLRVKWKREIEGHLPPEAGRVSYGKAVIRDVERLKRYPEAETQWRGASPWFRVELGTLYHRGLLVLLRGETLVLDEAIQDFRPLEPSEVNDAGLDTVFAYLVGKVPFEFIVEIDWEGDEYYPEPHLYCRFDGKGCQPYEAVTYHVEKGIRGEEFLSELIDHKDALANLKKARKLRKRHDKPTDGSSN